MSSSSSCELPLDCAALYDRPLESYGDVSGIGASPVHRMIFCGHFQLIPLQVLVGFVGTGYLALILFVCNYLIAYDPKGNPFGADRRGQEQNGRRPEQLPVHNDDKAIDSADWWHPNPIDVAFLGWIRSRTRRLFDWLVSPESCLRKLQFNADKAFTDCIIKICDVQALTGIAVLSSGYLSLQPNGCQPLSAYHWQIIVHLAWFSTITHLTGLAILRNHFCRRPRQRLVRWLLMLVLVLLLLVAFIPTVFFGWETSYTSPAAPASPAFCYFDVGFGAQMKSQVKDRMQTMFTGSVVNDPVRSAMHFGNCTTEWFCGLEFTYEVFDQVHQPMGVTSSVGLQRAVFSAALLVFSFSTHSIRMFGPSSRFAASMVRQPMSRFYRDKATRLLRWSRPAPEKAARTRLWRSMAVRPAVAAYTTVQLFLNLYASVLSEIGIVIFSLLWGTFRLAGTRITAPRGVLEEEDNPTFGQTLPVLLLIAPFFQIASAFALHTTRKSSRAPLPASREEPASAVSSDSFYIPAKLDGGGGGEKHWRPAQSTAPPQEAEVDTTEPNYPDNHTITAPWYWQSTLLLATSAVTMMGLLFQVSFHMDGRAKGLNWSEILISKGVLFAVFLLGPPMTFAEHLFGLSTQAWYGRAAAARSRWRRAVVLFFLLVPRVLLLGLILFAVRDHNLLTKEGMIYFYYDGFLMASYTYMPVSVGTTFFYALFFLVRFPVDAALEAVRKRRLATVSRD